MSQFYVVPGFEHLGEVKINCRLLRQQGFSPLVIVNKNCVADYAGEADKLVYCDDMFSEASIEKALLPDKEKIAQFASTHDKFWTAILGASVRLGIPYPNLRGQINCRIKARMRELLKETLPLNFEVLAREDCTRERVEAAIEKLGVPFVIKPVWGQGSDYVEIVRDKAQAFELVQEIFLALQEDSSLCAFSDGEKIWDARRQLLLEEFISGKEFSLEGFIQKGNFVPLMIQEKYFWGQEGNIHFETGNLSPTPFLAPDEKEKIYCLVRRALEKLELDDSFFHVELKWDGQRLNLVEVNPRLGGGSVPATLEFWYGHDFRELAMKLQTGAALNESFDGRDGFLLGVFVNAFQSGIFDSFEGIDWVQSRPEFCFDTKYFRTWQYIPPSNTVKNDRNAWMYGYDAFFHCHDLNQVDYLYQETQKRVRLKFKTEEEIAEFLAGEA